MTNSESLRPALRPLHAVLVEDSAADAELIAHELRRSGFDLTWQTNLDFRSRL